MVEIIGGSDLSQQVSELSVCIPVDVYFAWSNVIQREQNPLVRAIWEVKKAALFRDGLSHEGRMEVIRACGLKSNAMKVSPVFIKCEDGITPNAETASRLADVESTF